MCMLCVLMHVLSVTINALCIIVFCVVMYVLSVFMYGLYGHGALCCYVCALCDHACTHYVWTFISLCEPVCAVC